MTKTTSIHLPLFQRFDCHSCGYCCRNLVVNVTDSERETILKAGWQSRIPDRPLFKRYRFKGRGLYRLAKYPDDRCIFLSDDGLCRLHAETGIKTKPLACRLYPFVPTPGTDTVHIDLRVDCPSVAANKGRNLTVHSQEIDGLVRETGTRAMTEPPMWQGTRQLSMEEFQAVVAAFEGLLRKGSLPIRTRLLAGCYLLDLLYTIRVQKVRDDRLVELIKLLSEAAIEEAQQQNNSVNQLSKRPAKLFRQWLFLHTITDNPDDLDAGFLKKITRSWSRYRQARRFITYRGPVPPVMPGWSTADFEDIARIKTGPDDTLEPLCRSLRVKLDAHAFAGPGYYKYDLIPGLTALWLSSAVVGWLARLTAITKQRDTLTLDDILTGLRQAHHTYGVSPVFARFSERWRLRGLANVGTPAALLREYGP